MSAAPLVATGPPPSWEAHPDGPARVVVLTGSIGGGHVGPARELARRLVLAGHRAEVIDVVAAAPAGVGRMLRTLFRAQLSWAPGTWDRIFRVTDRDDAAAAGTGGLHHLLVPTLRAVLAQEPVAAVVSTFPLAGHAAARAIRDGNHRMPLITYLTDPAPHAAWIVDGTDRYLTGWTATAAELRRRTAAPVSVVQALVRPEFRCTARERAVHHREGRSRNGLVLVCSGSWGVGDLAGTVADLLSDRDGPTPVVVCGRNDLPTPTRARTSVTSRAPARSFTSRRLWQHCGPSPGRSWGATQVDR